MSNTSKEIKTGIKIPYIPIESFDFSKVLEKFSEGSTKENKEFNDEKQNCDSDERDFTDNIVIILQGMGMEKYIKLLKDQKVSFDTFLRLNEADLKELGITNDKDREIIVKNLSFHLRKKNKFEVSENHIEDLKIIKNVSNELLLLQNYCAYLELEMKRHKLTDYMINAEESACMYFKAFAECALKQSEILCCRIYDEQHSDGLIFKLLKAYNLTLPEALQEQLPKKKKSFACKLMIIISFSSLIILIGKFVVGKS